MKMNKKAALASLAALTLAAAVVAPSYAAETKREKKTGTLSSADLECVSDAVAEREDALLEALDEFAADSKAALTERKDDLKEAYTKTVKKELRAGVKSAWQEYRDSVRAARAELKAGKREAYAEFKAAAKECGVAVESSETSAPGEETLL